MIEWFAIRTLRSLAIFRLQNASQDSGGEMRGTKASGKNSAWMGLWWERRTPANITATQTGTTSDMITIIKPGAILRSGRWVWSIGDTNINVCARVWHTRADGERYEVIAPMFVADIDQGVVEVYFKPFMVNREQMPSRVMAYTMHFAPGSLEVEVL